MSDVKPGQIWERQSTPGAPWRRVRVENVLTDEVELRYLDLPQTPDLEQIFSTSRTHMLAGGGHGQGAAYRIVAGFELIEKKGDLSGLLRIRYGSGVDDPLPFVLTVTPQYVAHAAGKTLPLTHREIQEYADQNAEQLKAIAKNAKDRGYSTQVLE